MTNQMQIGTPEDAAALHAPHPIFIADRILKLNIGPFMSSVTFGNPVPAGQVMPASTVTLPTDRLLAVAEAIVAGIKGQAADIKDQQAAFQKRLK